MEGKGIGSKAKGVNMNGRERARSTKPILCYNIESLPKKKGGEGLYNSLRTAVKDGKATLVEELEIPPCDAISWNVPAGHLWHIICSHGPQVADMNCWSMSNPKKERFFSSKTRQIHATHLSRGDRLWSNMPFMRPLATITEDTIDYGFDEDGAGVHDVIGSRCDPYTHKLMSGEDKNDCCHCNLTRAALGTSVLSEEDVHDVLNVFMCTGFTLDTHQYFTKPSPVEVGDYIEFLAETDLIVAASTCPQGDVSIACGGGCVPVVYPLQVQVYKLEDELLTSKGWSQSEPSSYSGNHGL
mmetsp:Transcript_11562/g.14451  ORF Transcript_11562/g.14451 Transcript_11562/m.14451 type:complete len:298 (+) Transcript_11562:242-1135(+)